jgi:hypothetical protein
VCAGKLTAPAFESSLAVANHFRPRFTGKREEFVIAVFLNGQNQRLGEKDITEGAPTHQFGDEANNDYVASMPAIQDPYLHNFKRLISGSKKRL